MEVSPDVWFPVVARGRRPSRTYGPRHQCNLPGPRVGFPRTRRRHLSHVARSVTRSQRGRSFGDADTPDVPCVTRESALTSRETEPPPSGSQDWKWLGRLHRRRWRSLRLPRRLSSLVRVTGTPPDRRRVAAGAHRCCPWWPEHVSTCELQNVSPRKVHYLRGPRTSRMTPLPDSRTIWGLSLSSVDLCTSRVQISSVEGFQSWPIRTSGFRL